MQKDETLDIILIGDCEVGKTSLIHRYTGRGNLRRVLPTLGVDYVSKDITKRGKNYRIRIWDTSGSEKYKTVTASYYRKAHAAILLFDVTKESSFHNVAEWLANVRQYAKEQTLLFLAGNKIDLRGRFDCVDSSRVKAFASKEHLLYFDVSALEGSGVSECFERVVEDILNQRERQNIEQESSVFSRSITASERLGLEEQKRNEAALTPITEEQVHQKCCC